MSKPILPQPKTAPSAAIGSLPRTQGGAQAAGVLLVTADHPENVMDGTATPDISDLIAQTAAAFNVDKSTATVLVGLGGDFWTRVIRYAEDPVRFPLRPRRKKEVANG